MFFDRLDALCAERGITVTELMKELGLSPSSASRWKAKGYSPSRSASKQIADYFGITVRELMDGKKESAPPEDGTDDELANILEDARRRPELRVLFSMSRKATPEDVKQAIKIIQALGDNDGDDYS